MGKKAENIGVETERSSSFGITVGRMLVALSLMSIATIAYVMINIPAA